MMTPEQEHWHDEQSCEELNDIMQAMHLSGLDPEDVRLLMLSVIGERIQDMFDAYLLRVQDEVDMLNRWHALPS